MLRAPRGVVAQLVEHHNGIVGVRSSILLGSTILFFLRILDKSRRQVAVTLQRGGDGIVAFLAPHLSAYFGANIAPITQRVGAANQFGVIDLFAFTG